MSNEAIANVIAGFAFLVSIGSVVCAIGANKRSKVSHKTAQSALRFQVLLPILADYMSPDMYVAISKLWAFYKLDPDTLTQRYQNQRRADIEKISEYSGAAQVEFMKNTLDFHRRRVGQFYGILISVFNDDWEQNTWIYTYWSKRELAILPQIIIPLEEGLAEATGVPPSREINRRLLELYNNCPG